MSTDAAIFLIGMAGLLLGFVWGRWERQDSYIKGYKRGKMVGKAIAAENPDEMYSYEGYKAWLANEGK